MLNKIILGLGSNVGDRAEYLRLAILEIADFLEDIKYSSILESKALLPENAPDTWDMPYLNMAVSGKTNLNSREVLVKIKAIEQKLGREKIGHWSPRTIDIDILAMENLIINEPDLIIPHKELLNRDFALKPLLELVPDWKYPNNTVIPTKVGILNQDYRLRGNDKASLVGIINITPDSFSDGGVNYSPQKAIDAIKELIGQGAKIVDIGAESTRPNAIEITPAEEWARLEPVLKKRAEFNAIISVDTRYAETAKKSLEYGVNWINDVSGFSSPRMIEVIRNSDCKLVVMHSLSVPADKLVVMPENADVVTEIFAWAENRIKNLEDAGIHKDRIIFDVGIGFGKTPRQSQILIKNIRKFKELGVALFVGHSRKSFLGAKNIEDADQKTLEISKFLRDSGVDYLRVHNVKLHEKAEL